MAIFDNNIRSLIYFCGVIFLFYTSYYSCLNLFSQIFNQLGYKDLGNLTVFTITLGNAISPILFPFFCHVFSVKIWFLVASILFAIAQLFLIPTYYCSLNEYSEEFYCSANMIYIINLGLGFIIGFLNGISWMCQYAFLTNLFDYSTKGLFFGIYYGFFLGTFFSSGLLELVAFEISAEQVYFFVICECVTLISGPLFSFIVDVRIKKFLPEKSKGKKTCLNIIKLLWRKKKSPVHLLSILTGTEIGLYTCFFYKILEETLENSSNTNEVNLKTSQIYICLGIFEIIGGFFSSYFLDKVKAKYIAFVGFICVGLSYSLMMIIFFVYPDELFCFFIAALLGFGDCLLQSTICSIISGEENDYDNYVHYLSTQCFWLAISVLLTTISDYVFIAYIWIILIVCVSFWVLFEF